MAACKERDAFLALLVSATLLLRPVSPVFADGDDDNRGPPDQQILQVIRRHRLTLAPEVVLYFKTLSHIDLLLARLRPELEMSLLVRRFFANMTRVDTAAALDIRALVPAAVQFARSAASALEETTEWDVELRSLGAAAQRSARRLLAYGVLALTVGLGAVYLVTTT